MITFCRRAMCYGHISVEKSLLFARFLKLSDGSPAARERIAGATPGNQLFTTKALNRRNFLHQFPDSFIPTR